MKKNVKLFAALLALVMMLGMLAACNGGGADPTNTPEAAPSEPAAAPSEPAAPDEPDADALDRAELAIPDDYTKVKVFFGSYGFGMIVQEQGTVQGISIAENIFLGEESRFGRVLISRRKMNEEAKKVLAGIGFHDVDPAAPIESLDMQDRKLVEIAKTMYMDPEMLVVDETTTAPSQHDRSIIYDIMKRMRDDGKAVVSISHDLDELMDICDTLTVLRDGKLITTLDKEDFSEEEIKRCMVGRGAVIDMAAGHKIGSARSARAHGYGYVSKQIEDLSIKMRLAQAGCAAHRVRQRRDEGRHVQGAHGGLLRQCGQCPEGRLHRAVRPRGGCDRRVA